MSRLTEQEHGLVQEVLQAAEAKYLLERQINPKTIFNLMKVLSAYNEVLPRHGISSTEESRILNYLVHVNRRYDPQNKEQWKALVSLHLTLKTGSSGSRHSSNNRSRSRAHSTIVDSHPRNKIEEGSRISEFNPTSTNRKDLPAEEPSLVNRSFSNYQLVQKSQMQASRRSRESRQPFDNKENSQIHINSNYVLCDKTTISEHGHSTFDSSFQQGHISKLLGPTEEPLTEELAQMNERARLFHEVNLKTKVFLIFKATCLIHDEARNRLRGILRYCRGKQLRHYFALVMQGVQNIKHQKTENVKAAAHYLKNIKKKVFGFLRALKHLEVNREQHQKYSSNWLVNEFAKQAVNSSFRMDEQLFRKYEYFLNNEKFHELALLFKIFGGIQPTSHETLVKFYQEAKLSQKRRVFASWKASHRAERRLEKEIHNLHLMNHAVSALKANRQNQAHVRTQLMRITTNYQQQLLKSSFSVFVGSCQRLRLDRTKEQYIRERSQQLTKVTFMRILQQKLQLAKLEFVRMQQTKTELQEHYNRELKALVFIGGFKQYWEQRTSKKAKLARAVEYQQLSLQEKVFKALVGRVLERKKVEYLSNKLRLNFNVKPFFRLWKCATGFDRLGRSLQKHSLKTAFEAISCISEANHRHLQNLAFISDRIKQRILVEWAVVTLKQKNILLDKQKLLESWLHRQRRAFLYGQLRRRRLEREDQQQQLRAAAFSFRAKISECSAQTQTLSATDLCGRLLRQQRHRSVLRKLKEFEVIASSARVLKRKTCSLLHNMAAKHFNHLRRSCFNHIRRRILAQKQHDSNCKRVFGNLMAFVLINRKKKQNLAAASKQQLQRNLAKKRMLFCSMRSLLSSVKDRSLVAQKHHDIKLQERAWLLLRSVFIVRKQTKRGHQKLIERIKSMLRNRASVKLFKALSLNHYATLSRKLTAKRVEVLSKKRYIGRIKSQSGVSADSRHRQSTIKLLAGRLLLGRLRNRISQKRVINFLEKRLALKQFMLCMYARIYTRKLFEISYHHYKHRLLRTALYSLRVDFAHHRSADEATAPQVPQSLQQKHQIIDLLNYYSKS